MNFTSVFRPNSLNDFRGQSHLVSADAPLAKLIKSKNIPNIFLFGPPGIGKTTLGRIIANEIGSQFYELNGGYFKTDEFKEIAKNHQNSLIKAVVFIDEVHRLSKNQQELMLPIMENTNIKIIGASTENPYFSLTNAIRSRSFLFELYKLNNTEMDEILQKVCEQKNIELNSEVKNYLIESSNGDARSMINLLEFAYTADFDVSIETLKNLRSHWQVDSTNNSESHYDFTSALIKSIRGSDIDASLYWLARLIVGAEEPAFIARRLVILASEDIGNANPNALNLAVSTMNAVAKIGYPEARIVLSQCVIYLASCPKSNASYLAINNSIDYATLNQQNIPSNLKNGSKQYLYPHDFDGYVEQIYMENPKKFYDSKLVGFEKTLDEWNKKIKNKE